MLQIIKSFKNKLKTLYKITAVNFHKLIIAIIVLSIVLFCDIVNKNYYFNQHYFTQSSNSFDNPKQSWQSRRFNTLKLKNLMDDLDKVRNNFVAVTKIPYKNDAERAVIDNFPLQAGKYKKYQNFEMISCVEDNVENFKVGLFSSQNRKLDGGTIDFFEVKKDINGNFNPSFYTTIYDSYYRFEDLKNIFKERKCNNWFNQSPARDNDLQNLQYSFSKIERQELNKNLNLDKKNNLLKIIEEDPDEFLKIFNPTPYKVAIKLSLFENSNSLKDKILQARNQIPYLRYIKDEFVDTQIDNKSNIDLTFCKKENRYLQVAIPSIGTGYNYMTDIDLYDLKFEGNQWYLYYAGVIKTLCVIDLYPKGWPSERAGLNVDDKKYKEFREYKPRLQTND